MCVICEFSKKFKNMTKESERPHLLFADRKNLEEILRKALKTGPLIVDNSSLRPFLYSVNEETLESKGKVGGPMRIGNIVEYVKAYGLFNRQLNAAKTVAKASKQVYDMYKELSQDFNFYLVGSEGHEPTYMGDYNVWEISTNAHVWHMLAGEANKMRDNKKRVHSPTKAARDTPRILNTSFRKNRDTLRNIVENARWNDRVIFLRTFFENESYLNEPLWSEIHDKRFSAGEHDRITMFLAWVMSRELSARVFIETMDGDYLGMTKYVDRRKEELVGKTVTGALPEVVVIFDRPSKFPLSMLQDYYPIFISSYDIDPVKTKIPEEMFSPELPVK